MTTCECPVCKKIARKEGDPKNTCGTEYAPGKSHKYHIIDGKYIKSHVVKDPDWDKAIFVCSHCRKGNHI